MIARFDLQYRRQPQVVGAISRKTHSRTRGWPLVGGLTVLFVLWEGYRAYLSPSWLAGLEPLLSEMLLLLELATTLTLILLWSVLFWRHKQTGFVVGRHVDREDLFEMSPAEFERFVARLFQRKGYLVEIRGGSGDHGVDLELQQPGGKRAVVQCKRYRNQIGPDIARELYGTLIHERAAHAFLVTTADISQATREWVQGKPITLIDGGTLLDVASAIAAEVSA
jgi:HJR/Mrr/RecB family endonuclease